MTTIRQLRPEDDRTQFKSGDADLDRFLSKYAGQNQFKHHIGTTYVAVDEANGVFGYVTVAPGSIEFDDLPEADRKNLPQYPLPVLRIARLAVDERFRGRRLGQALLRYAFQLADAMANEYGCVGVVVDAKQDAVDFYTPFGFEAIDVVEGESSARPNPTSMFLSLRAIRAAKPSK